MEKSYIERIKEMAQKGKEAYSENLEEILKKEIVILRGALKKCVDSHAREEQFGLIVSNDSSSDIQLYEMVDRVKSPESLEEKIIRNQEFFDLIGKEGSELIEAIQKSNDDLMGLRFLVSLSCDCGRLFDLLDKYQGELAEESIIFLNLKQNPQTMRNGRPIYRIKGKYKTYPFELQIKSKVDSAWADIEHMLFYKDYQFSYIQSTNKQVMKKLGDLLDQVDELMIQIRESQASYEKDRKEMEFTQYLGKKFRNQIKEKIGSAFVLSDYRKIFFNIFSQFEKSQQEIILAQRAPVISAEFYFLKIKDKESKFVKNYKRLMEHSLEFVISEHIYVEWLNNIGQLESATAVTDLAKYFRRLITGLFLEKMEYYLKNNYIDNDYIEWAVETIPESLENREMTFRFPLFLTNSEKMYMLYSFYKADKRIAADIPISDSLETDAVGDEIGDLILKIKYEVISFLFEDDREKSAQNISGIIDENDYLRKYYSLATIDGMKEVYEKVKKTASGKEMPENKLSVLFQEVLHLRQEGNGNE